MNNGISISIAVGSFIISIIAIVISYKSLRLSRIANRKAISEDKGIKNIIQKKIEFKEPENPYDDPYISIWLYNSGITPQKIVRFKTLTKNSEYRDLPFSYKENGKKKLKNK